jgi:hypothetical protein
MWVEFFDLSFKPGVKQGKLNLVSGRLWRPLLFVNWTFHAELFFWLTTQTQQPPPAAAVSCGLVKSTPQATEETLASVASGMY